MGANDQLVRVFVTSCLMCVCLFSQKCMANEAVSSLAHRYLVPSTGEADRYAVNVRSVELTTYTDSTIPFLASRVKDISVWRVSGDISMVTKGQDTLLRIFTLYFDSTSNAFLRGELLQDSTDLPLFREPTAAEAEQQLRALGEEFVDYVVEEPTVTMIEALMRDSPYYAWAERIVVWYVSYFRQSNQKDPVEAPAWVFCMSLTEPFLDRPTIPDHMTKSRRAVIHGTTGVSLVVSNVPYPVLE